MNLEVWRRIFEMSSNEVLLQIAKKHKIKIPGFRTLKLDNSFKILRPKLIQIMTEYKKLNVIISELNSMVENDEVLINIRSKSVEELITLFAEGTNPYSILVSLYSSENNEHHILGEMFYLKVKETGDIDKYDKEMTNIKVADEDSFERQHEVETMQKEASEIEKKMQRLQRKYDDLTNLLDNQKGKFQKEINEIEKNKNIVIKENKLINEKLKILEETLTKKNNDIFILENILRDKEEVLNSKEEQILALSVSLTEEKINYKDRKYDDENEIFIDLHIVEPLRKIVMIGVPINEKLGKYREIIKMIDSNEIEKSIEENLFYNIDEIWILTFEISLSKKRKLLDSFKEIKICEFTNILELQIHIENEVKLGRVNL